jgi:hypothetical protein
LSKRRLLWCLAPILAALVAWGCMQKFDEREDPSIAEIMRIGMEFLQDNQGGQAAEAFRAALKVEPDNVDAKYALHIARIMQFLNLIDQLVGILQTVQLDVTPTDAGGAVPTVRGSETQNHIPPIGDYLHDFFYDNVDGAFLHNEELYWSLANHPDFSIFVPSYVLQIQGSELLSLSGEFDKTDLHFFGALSSLVYGVDQILLAHNINFDFKNMSLDFSGDGLEVIDGVIDFLNTLLTDPAFPDFLTLLPDDQGVQRMQAAGVQLGMVFYRIDMMFEQLAKETDPQAMDQITYLDMNNNGRYDIETDPLLLANLGQIDPQLAVAIKLLCSQLAIAFFDNTVFDIHPTQPDPLPLSALNGVLVAMGVLDEPVLPDWISISIGPWFAAPTEDGLKTLLFDLIDIYGVVTGFLG